MPNVAAWRCPSVPSQASSIGVTEEVIETFNKMGNRWKYMICKINVEAGMIQLHKKVASGSGKEFYNVRARGFPQFQLL